MDLFDNLHKSFRTISIINFVLLNQWFVKSFVMNQWPIVTETRRNIWYSSIFATKNKGVNCKLIHIPNEIKCSILSPFSKYAKS